MTPETPLAMTPQSAERFARRLRLHDPPVIARIERGRVLLDARTVLEGEDEAVVVALRTAMQPDG